jgi:apolipoprotein N-acyltransferase
MKRSAIALAAGGMSALGFQPLGLWPLALGAVALLLWLVETAPSRKVALARGWWFGLGQFAVSLNWIATAFTFQAAMPAWLGWVAVVLLSLYLAVFPALAAALAWMPRRSPLTLVVGLAAAWIVAEWLRATLFTGFAWNPLGVVLLPTVLSWTAATIGTYGLSGLAVLLGGALFLAFHEDKRAQGAVLALVLLAAGGLARIATGVPVPASGPALRIVQPNIGQEEKWSPTFEARNLARLGELSHEDEGGGRRILVWPEAAVTEPLQDERLLETGVQDRLEATRRSGRELVAPAPLLLTGGITIESRDRLLATGATNSVFAVDPSGRVLARYDKAHLVPYGEYLPMRPLLSAIGLSRLAPGDLDFDPGPGPRTLDLPYAGRVGFQLCYEIIFSGNVVDRHDRPAWIFNPSNDAWFGSWGPPQHLAQARLRALEEGIPIVRATPTGISAVIDASGDLLAFLPQGRAGVIDARLPAARVPGLFARTGNLAALLFALVLAAVAIALRRKAR